MIKHTLTGTLDDHLALMAAEAPHALIQDWWRRLECVLGGYADARSIERPQKTWEYESLVSEDDRLGHTFAVSLKHLRDRRNRITHGRFQAVSSGEAIFAQKAFKLIGSLSALV